MPLSKTKSTSTKNWNYIYDKIIRPAVEDSGLDFECKRSRATRGNVIKQIIKDLNESDLVIADMTDHNANVCYELGIRHGLTVGTILLAQKRKFLQIFDLHDYGSHVYKWKTENNRINMIKKIRELLDDFLEDPLRIDNPPQDFLKRKSVSTETFDEIKNILEYDSQNNPQIVLGREHLTGRLAVGLILYGNSPAGVSMKELVNQVSKNWKKVQSTSISPILTQQMGGWILKEGKPGNYIYKLSKKGRREVLALTRVIST